MAATQSPEEKADFDPYVGRNLYSFLFDLNFSEIRVKVGSHHLIYGPVKEKDPSTGLKKWKSPPNNRDMISASMNLVFKVSIPSFKLFSITPYVLPIRRSSPVAGENPV